MRWKARGLPTAPGGLPILGHALILARHTPWDVMARWYEAAGGPVRFTAFTKQLVVIAEPAHLRLVWQTTLRAYCKDQEFTYGPFLPLLGTGLVTSEGEEWRRQRALVSGVFRIEILDEIVGMAKRAADRLCLKLDRHCASGDPIDLEKEFRELTLQVIAEALLSLPSEESDRVFPELYLPIMEEANRRVLRPWRKYLPTPAWFAFRRRVRALDAYVVGLLRARWALRGQEAAAKGPSGRRVDILDRMLDAYGEGWSDGLERQLCFDFKTFILAGHETSAAMLAWSLLECSRNSKIRDKVRSEARAIGLRHAMEPTDEAKLDAAVRRGGALEYTSWVLKEALRKYSVVPVVVRTSTEDTHIGPHCIPKGTNVCCLIQATHRLEQYWPQPDAFRPERFSQPLQDRFQFVPFIEGPRNCIGQHLALLESQVVLAQLLSEYEFTPVHPVEKHPWVVPVGPADGMHMRVAK